MNSSGKRAIFLVGPPGVGKSTWVSRVKTSLNPIICSSDAFIERAAEKSGVSYNDAFLSTVGRADKAFRRQLRRAIKTGRPIIIDRTNMSIKTRRPLIRMFESTGYNLEAIVFKHVFWAQWAERLNSRPNKTIPANVLGGMLLSYEHPTEREGFSNVYYV